MGFDGFVVFFLTRNSQSVRGDVAAGSVTGILEEGKGGKGGGGGTAGGVDPLWAEDDCGREGSRGDGATREIRAEFGSKSLPTDPPIADTQLDVVESKEKWDLKSGDG